jgi:hypothetical protein
MGDWKRPFLIGAGWGLGTVFGLAIALGGFLWYQSRPRPPKPPKPWDSASIKAQYDDVDTEGDKHTIVFNYTLENTTDFDYQIEDSHNVIMTAKLQRQNDLSPFGVLEKIDYPIFAPAKKRVRFPIHLGYPYPVQGTANANGEERRKHREAVEKYVVDELSNLDGFDLLDEANRCEIIFPAGWKRSKQ